MAVREPRGRPARRGTGRPIAVDLRERPIIGTQASFAVDVVKGLFAKRKMRGLSIVAKRRRLVAERSRRRRKGLRASEP